MVINLVFKLKSLKKKINPYYISDHTTRCTRGKSNDHRRFVPWSLCARGNLKLTSREQKNRAAKMSWYTQIKNDCFVKRLQIKHQNATGSYSYLQNCFGSHKFPGSYHDLRNRLSGSKCCKNVCHWSWFRQLQLVLVWHCRLSSQQTTVLTLLLRRSSTGRSSASYSSKQSRAPSMLHSKWQHEPYIVRAEIKCILSFLCCCCCCCCLEASLETELSRGRRLPTLTASRGTSPGAAAGLTFLAKALISLLACHVDCKLACLFSV